MQNKIIIEHELTVNTQKNPGYIFILSNYGYPGCVKIGKTVMKPDIFAANLTKEYSSPYPFIAELGRFIENDMHKVKRVIFKQLKEFQITAGSSFFQLTVIDAVKKVDDIVSEFLIASLIGDKYGN